MSGFFHRTSASIVSWDLPGQTIWLSDSENSDGKAQVLPPLAACIWRFWWKQMEWRSASICVIILIVECWETPRSCLLGKEGPVVIWFPLSAWRAAGAYRQLEGKTSGLTAGIWPEVSCLCSLKLCDLHQMPFSAWILSLRVLNAPGYWGQSYQTIMREVFAFLRQHAMQRTRGLTSSLISFLFFLDT